MKKVNLSQLFHQKRLFFSIVVLSGVIPLFIFWIIPTMKLWWWNFTHFNTGSLGLQIQAMSILSVITYPLYSFALCVGVSLFRPLKSQDESGLLSDTWKAIKTGCLWFLAATGICFMGYSMEGLFPLVYLIGAINISLFAGTAIGIAMSFYFLSKEFNSNKLPTEEI